MNSFRIYHNPHCSKSRQTLELLQASGIEPEIILYLKTPPNADELANMLNKLGMTARDIIRTGEDEYKEQNLKNPDLSDVDLLAAMVAFPKLMERPIVVKGNKAILGRPPENVLTLIKE